MYWESLTALLQVVAIDVALAGDNAIVVGMAAAGLPVLMRKRAILIGILAAAALRIAFASFTMQLLQIVGLLLAGGLLLLWVAWKLWRELSGAAEEERAEAEQEAEAAEAAGQGKTFSQAVSQIVIADVSMSLDNVLAVAGASRDHEWVLVIGLALSVALMGLAANLVARLLNRFRWIAYVGLVIILYVAVRMIWDGAHEVMAYAAALN
ncbi:MAG: YjbE family putative metal transport protein [Magnetospirillum sp.]|nr:YjbE family putative metal transport protein [Magnetospirillum sp.]